MDELLALLAMDDTGWGDELAAGTWISVSLALATAPLGLLVGLLLALAKDSGDKTLRFAANIYTTIFRGLPELLTILIVYYGGQILLLRIIGLFSDAHVEINGFVAGMFALGFVFSAYSSEVFLSALRGIPKGQPEAAVALGLSNFQAFRLVVLPQLIRLCFSSLSNLWLLLLKDTSLVSVIALNDLIRQTQVAVGSTKQPLLFYSVAAAIYIILALISANGLNWAEARVNRGQEARS